jgi:hypothetical protein
MNGWAIVIASLRDFAAFAPYARNDFNRPLPRSSTPNCHWPPGWDIAGERARPGCRFRRPAGFVPQGQLEISQTRSVWFIVPSKSVLKGRRNPSSFQDGQIYRTRYQPLRSWLISIASLRDFAVLAVFARKNSNALCPVRPPQTGIADGHHATCPPAGLRVERTTLHRLSAGLLVHPTCLQGRPACLQNLSANLQGLPTCLQPPSAYLFVERTYLQRRSTYLRNASAYLQRRSTYLRNVSAYLQRPFTYLRNASAGMWKGSASL